MPTPVLTVNKRARRPERLPDLPTYCEVCGAPLAVAADRVGSVVAWCLRCGRLYRGQRQATGSRTGEITGSRRPLDGLRIADPASPGHHRP
jgi:hypothetical protein